MQKKRKIAGFGEADHISPLFFQAAKQLKKGVDDSLKTAPKKALSDDLDLRKRRTGEFAFGETLTLASKALETDPIAMRVSVARWQILQRSVAEP